jgi:2-dehydro-3-deoxygluconokinase
MERATMGADVKDLDVVALGEALIEFNQTHEDPPTYLQGFGGDTSNAIIAATRAGASCAYLTLLGEDSWAQRLLQLWQSENVSVEGVRSLSGQRTGLYFVHHDASGHHFSYARSGSAASLMTPNDLHGDWQDLIRRSRWLHVSGISLAISESAKQTTFAAMELARQVGTRVSLDTNLRLSLWSLAQARECLQQAIQRCDLVQPSLEDMVHLTGSDQPLDIVNWCHAQGAKQVVLKMGAQGALISQGGTTSVVKAKRVQAVDATGAGDCFCGNLLARCVQGDDLMQAARWANAAAALSVQGRGAIAPLPRAKQVQAFLDA